MKIKLILGVILVFAAGVQLAFAQVVIVNETFDDYADDAAYLAVWEPRNGIGDMPPGVVDASLLTMDDTLYPGIEGKAADHFGGAINQYLPTGSELRPSPGNELIPTVSQHIFLSADIYENGAGNKRLTVGLRSRDPSENIIEMGLYNAPTCDPTVSGCNPGAATSMSPGYVPYTGYGYRMQLFPAGGLGGGLLTNPNWQYFELPEELDRVNDTDEFTTIADIGAGWHRYMVTIAPTEITMEIDLWRDGLRNTSKTIDEETGMRPGTEGVDASVTWQVTTTANAYDSLRIGGPSGLTSPGPGGVAFDNIYLALIDPPSGDLVGDHNGDGFVNAADYVFWRDFLSDDAQGYTDWHDNFGDSAGVGSTGNAAVPEPTSLLLAGLAIVGLLGLRRRTG